jgi:gas vesicle protein
MMSFIKGMAAGLVVGAVAGVILTPKPKRYAAQMKRTADRAVRGIGDLVDNVMSVIGGG